MRVHAATLVVVVALTAAARVGVAEQSVPPRSQWDGVYTDDQANRGRRVYGTHCVQCHGPDLKGVPLPKTVAGQTASVLVPLVGDVFASHWDRLPLFDLWKRIRISMPQYQPGILNRSEVSDVLAFMLQEGQYPSGPTELQEVTGTTADVVFLRAQP